MSVRTVAGLRADTYQIDTSASRVAFTVPHLFGLGTAEGTFTISSGTVVVAPEPVHSRVTATIDATSFHTDKPRRDKHINQILNTSRYPEITYTSRAVTPVDGGKWRVDGALTVCGVEVDTPLTLLAAEATPSGCQIRASARVDRYAFGVKAARGIAGRYLDFTLTIALLTS